jgi:hypothetical protein
MANLKHKLHVLALCAAALTFLGGQLLAQLPKPKVAIVAINEAKADKELFNLARDTFAGSLKSAWGLKVVDNFVAKLALRQVNSVEKIKAAGKLLSMDYICVVGLFDDPSGLQMCAAIFDAATGEHIAEQDKAVNTDSPEKDVVRLSKILAKEMDKALKKNRLGEKAGALKDLVKK